MPVIPFYDSETNGFVYRVILDAQSHYPETISEFSSETESWGSRTTLASDELSGYFIQHRGHPQPASDNFVWWFPADNTRRFILRHYVEKYIHGGNHAPIVRDTLPENPVKTYHVLELGTRDGTWVQEMATEFPHVQFRSLDVAPIVAHLPRSNVVFEVYDFTERILLEDFSQDVVFLNNMFELVKNYRALLREVHRVLRPGGLIHVREFEPVIFDSQDTTKPARRTHPIGCSLMDIVQNAISQVGIDPQTFQRLPEWLASGDKYSFERVRMVEKTFPVYPHDTSLCGHKPIEPHFAPFLEHLAVMSLRDLPSLLCDIGMKEDEAERFIEEAIEEMRRPNNCSEMKLHCIYAVKKM